MKTSGIALFISIGVFIMCLYKIASTGELAWFIVAAFWIPSISIWSFNLYNAMKWRKDEH